jgi:hypothetical protein
VVSTGKEIGMATEKPGESLFRRLERVPDTRLS